MNRFDFERCTRALRLGFFAAVATLALMSFASTTAFAQADPPPAERPTCDEKCAEKAALMEDRCEAAGGENCAARAAEFLTKCTERCATVGTRPTCDERCEREATALLARCEAASGTDCTARVDAHKERCMNRCDRIDTARELCAGGCEDRAEALKARCVAGGGTDCDDKAERARNHCQRTCARIGPGRGPGGAPGPRDPGPRDPGVPPGRPGRP